MSHPLIKRLVDTLGYPQVDAAILDRFLAEPDLKALFVTGDADKNLETADLAVILPELARHFGKAFQPAVVDRAIEQKVRERFDVWPTPSLIFVARGNKVGAIAKIRDWDDYLREISAILDREPALLVH
ncbi:thioredoxin domain-containing protein [Jiella marina]|uniref:hydrogenase n=1 Tax=Jiella sp. LLJ827 TaxID=2917712 RepID=UPI002100CECC|nr:hydrogenase [Jiella sp. LLJ827]MCQ0988214.1 hydrogenase [Jiella sp. LLJ827]